MYLKSMVLRGFKSFADRTELKFEPGLTVVIGPNGSGKSNISDAILWVLGEQSAKQLRGRAMEDVIFAGSSARKAVGIAEVDLILDNSDGTLPVDFQEVMISRRMYRSGESEYLINGAPSRLRDILDILHDSGLGKDTHSIISQGKLVEVLSAKPEDRRSLIEEAAGIAKHMKRKARAERKLERMDESLRRATDLKQEIDRQLRPLERQMDRAKRAQEITAELQHLSTVLAVDDLRVLQRRYGSITEREQEVRAQEELDLFRQAEKERELEKLQVLLEEQGLFVGDLAERRRHMQTILERLDASMRLLEEKGNNMVDRLSGLRGTIFQAERRLRSRTEEREQISSDLAATTGEVEHLDAELLTRKAALDAAVAARREHEDAFRQLMAVADSTTRERDRLELTLAKARESLSSVTVEDEMYASRLAQLEETIEETVTLLAERNDELTRGERELEEARSAVDEARTGSTAAVEKLDAARTERDETRSRLIEATSRRSGIEEVMRALDDANPLRAALLQEKLPALSGMVSDIIGVPANLESAVERVLGVDALALVVDDTRGLADALDRVLAGDRTGHIEFLAASMAAAEPVHSSVGTPLIDDLTFDERYRGIVTSLLGDVFLVGSTKQALDALEQGLPGRYLAPDGLLASGDGRITLGSPTQEGRGALERSRELAELTERIPELETAAEEALEAVAREEAAVEQARAALSELTAKKSELDRIVAELGRSIGRTEKELSVARAEQERVSVKRDSLTERAAAERERIASGEKDLALLVADLEELDSRRTPLLEARNIGRDAEREAESAHNDIRLAHARATERKAHLVSRRADLDREVEELESTLNVSHETERKLEVLRERVEPLHELYATIRESALGWAVRLRDQAQLKEADSSSLRETIEQARKATVEAREALERTRASQTTLQVDKGKLDVQVEAAIAAIVEPGHMNLEAALELPEPEDREASEQQLTKLKRSLANIGPVNQVAVEEYDKLSERAQYIDTQVVDLRDARKSLDRILRAIDRKMRRKFLETYEEVDRNFTEIVGEFFPGGEGHLVMTEPDDPENTGIDVVAQPAGKRIRNISQLSGGERSLIALALLFAVYRTRTVPFYVLDEVEAALDDSNLDRFLSALDHLKERTQLIVVSHQRRTMERADVLYGVSMRSDGVSSVISQRLDTLPLEVD